MTVEAATSAARLCKGLSAGKGALDAAFCRKVRICFKTLKKVPFGKESDGVRYGKFTQKCQDENPAPFEDSVKPLAPSAKPLANANAVGLDA